MKTNCHLNHAAVCNAADIQSQRIYQLPFRTLPFLVYINNFEKTEKTLVSFRI